MKNLFGLAFRYVKHNIHRSITTAIGIMLSTVIIYLIFSIGYSGYDSITEQKYLDSMGWDVVYMCDVETAEDILTLVPYYENEPAIVDTDIDLSHGFYICIDSTYAMTYINDFEAMPIKYKLKYGDYPKEKGEQMVSIYYARERKISVGDVYEYVFADFDYFTNQRVDHKTDIKVTGIHEETYIDNFSEGPPLYIWSGGIFNKVTPDMKSDIEYLQLYITFSNKENIENQANQLAQAFGINEYKLNPHAINAYVNENRENAIDYLGLEALLLILATLGAICAMFIVRNAFNISVHQRNVDYGILRCIGMDRKQIIKVILIEAMIISILGISIGIILGHGLSVVGFDFVRRTLGYKATFRARFYIKALVLTIIYSLVTTCYSMVAPIEKLYKQNPVEAFNRKGEYKNEKIKAKKGKLFTKIFGFEVGYAYKSTVRRKGRFIITITTLLISVFLFITLSTAYYSMEKYVEKNVLAKNVYDGYFEVECYDESQEIKEALIKRNLTNKISIYHINETSYIDDYGFTSNEKTYLGLEQVAFDEIKSNSNIAKPSKEDNVINIIVTDDFTKYQLGESFELHTTTYVYETDEYVDNYYTFYIRGVISKHKFKEIIGNYGIYVGDEEQDSRKPQLIYALGGDFDGIEFGFSEDFNTMHSEYLVKIDLKDVANTEEFDKYINDVNYIYYDEHYDAMLVFKTVKSYKIIVTAFIVLVLLMYLTNIINVNKADFLIRKNEFKILRHIGMSKKQLNKVLLSENLIGSIIAVLLGSILGTIVGNLLIYTVFSMEDIKYNISVDFVSIAICIFTMIIFSICSTVFTKNKD